MIAYHGTPEELTKHDTLLPSRHGSFGSGIYFADKNAATEYVDGGSLLAFDIDIDALLRVTADFDVAMSYGLDTAALPLLMAVFELNADEAAEKFMALTTDGFLLGREIEMAVRNKGYLGVYADYGDCFELVTYQIPLEH